MNLMLKLAMFCGAGLMVVGTGGCKVTECTETLPDGGTTKKENCLQLQPTVEYRDARIRGGGKAWTSGRTISITNTNGPLTVDLGNPGEDRVQFVGKAFTRETSNAEGEQKAKEVLAKMPDPVFAPGDNIDLTAPGGGVDGYDLTVYIPPEFDAAIKVVNGNGTTTIVGADGTTSTDVTSHGIIATKMRRTVKLYAKVGDIVANGVPSGPGSVIETELGKVDVHIGAANLTITAVSESGTVEFPTGWPANLSENKRSGSATLGDGSGALDVKGGGSRGITFHAQ